MKYQLLHGPHILLDVEGNDAVALRAVAARLEERERQDGRQTHHQDTTALTVLVVGDGCGNRVLLDFTRGQIQRP